jgi:orotate phosphoribosyltransferase
MNVTFIDAATFTQTLAETEVLATLEGPGGGQTFVGCRDGADILIITDAITGGAAVIHQCSEDRDAGCSIHDHARVINAA